MVEFIGNFVAGVFLETLALAVDNRARDRIIDLINRVFAGGEQQIEEFGSGTLRVKD